MFLAFAQNPSSNRSLIGVSLPLSGDSAVEGQEIQSILNFLNQELYQGRVKYLFEDDRCSDSEAVTVAQRLSSGSGVKAVLGFACSGAVLASAPIYEKAGITVIAVAAGAPKISEAGDHIFRTIPNLNVAATRLYNYSKKHFKSVAILSEETAYCQGLAEAFMSRNSSHEIEIFNTSYLPRTVDFKTLLVKLKSRKCDALFINPQSEPGMIEIYRQLQALNWNIPILAAYYPGFSNFRSAFGDSAKGIVYADLPFVESALTETGKELFEKFNKTHGMLKSSDFYFVTVLAALTAIIEAINSDSEIPQYLYQKRFEVVKGGFSFDRAGDVVGDNLTFVLKSLRHRDAVLLEGE